MLSVCAALVLLAWASLRRENERHQQRQFALLAQDVTDDIAERLRQHEQILLGGAGLMDASVSASRQAWHDYVSRLNLQKNYPGILGVGFSQVIAPAELDAHVARIRSEGFPEYQVRPPGPREIYTSIIYIEPFTGRNLAAFGYDMWSEPTRKKSMRRAVENGATAITGRVTLVQENEGRVQAGFLMYVPVFRKGMPTGTADERMRALEGFAYSPYRVEDLMAGIMGSADAEVDFKIVDDALPAGEGLMYDSAAVRAAPASAVASAASPVAPAPHHVPSISSTHSLTAYGHTFSIEISSRQQFDERYASTLPWVVLTMGGGITILIALLIAAALRQRDRAQALADEMTADIRRREAERQHQHVEMQRLSGRLHVATQAAHVGIWDYDVVNSSLAWDEIMYALYGINRTHFAGVYEAWRSGVHPDDVARADAEIAQALAGGKPFDTEFRVVWPTGEVRWIRAVAKVLRDPEGKPLHMIGTNWDITVEKKADLAKAEFVSTVSHELRTPLTSISGALGLVAGGALGTLPEPVQCLLDMARRNAERLAQLISDLLDTEGLLSGKVEFALIAQPVLPLIRQALDTTAPYAQQYKVQFRLETTQSSAQACVDARRFEQVMTNLLSNAAKFSPEQGEVLVRLIETAQHLRVEVQDQGSGVPEAFRERIFQKFSQADSSDTRSKSGTGLGLSITRNLIERMHGSIGFESAPGRGTCFYFELPAVAASATEETA
jgi:signal transduction histidine kinase